MFTKVGEIIYRVNEANQTKDIGKKYVYTDLDLLDIVSMAEQSDFNINYVYVSVDDEYTYGAGRHTIEEFRSLYDDIYSLKSVSFDITDLKAKLVVMPDQNEAFLDFKEVKETPATEITDILKEKKMKM